MWPWGGKLKWRSHGGHWDGEQESQSTQTMESPLMLSKQGWGEDGGLMPSEGEEEVGRRQCPGVGEGGHGLPADRSR